MAFEQGAMDANGDMEIFVPWPGFNDAPKNDNRYLVPELSAELLQFAEIHHPNWGACSRGAKRLHARNGCQVAGLDLRTPVDMVVCWTPGGSGSGGTGQAIRMAKSLNIPVFDLARQDDWQGLVEFSNRLEQETA